MEHNNKMEPTIIDYIGLRTLRQDENDNRALAALLDLTTIIPHSCNQKQLERLLPKLNMTYEELTAKCREDRTFAIVVASNISINASRQGVKDESYILNVCNKTANTLGIQITNLSTTASIPTKCGKILNGPECKTRGMKKNDCLKSFDARITGRINGWIFAKITVSSGGHQDNVFEEAHIMGEWFVKYGHPDELYVLLIDTNLASQFSTIKTKYHGKNILVVNHVEFQQYLLDNCSSV